MFKKIAAASALALVAMSANARQLDVSLCYRIAKNADFAARASLQGAPVSSVEGKWADGADSDPHVAAARERAIRFSYIHEAPGVVALTEAVPECRDASGAIIRARRGW